MAVDREGACGEDLWRDLRHASGSVAGMTSDPRMLIDWLVVTPGSSPTRNGACVCWSATPATAIPRPSAASPIRTRPGLLRRVAEEVEQRWAKGERFVARRRWGRGTSGAQGNEFKG